MNSRCVVASAAAAMTAALSASLPASPAMAAVKVSPARTLCNVGGVERAGPTAVWIYFIGRPVHVKVTRGHVSRVVYIKPPSIWGNQQVMRPALYAQLGDKLFVGELTCFMTIVSKNGRLGIDAFSWPLAGDRADWSGYGWLPQDGFIPARSPAARPPPG